MWYKIKKIYLWTQLVWPKPTYDAGIYHNATLWLISISADWANWVTIADKNYWATTVYNSWDTVSAANAGNFFQWWNNYPFPYSWATNIVTSQTSAATYSWQNPYSSSTFRNVNWYHRDSSENKDLRWDVTNTLEARKWPCDTGRHVPTLDELFWLLDLWNTLWAWNARPSVWTNFATYMKIPICYLHNWAYPYTYLWWLISSSFWNDESWDADQLSITSTWTANKNNMSTVWINLRPFKNSPVVPDSSWTKIWPIS